jgi:hypothetical protein
VSSRSSGSADMRYLHDELQIVGPHTRVIFRTSSRPISSAEMGYLSGEVQAC